MTVKSCLMYCFSFFRNQLWQHLISYNSFRNMNMCLLEVAMCEKCRSSHSQSEGGAVRNLRTGVRLKKFRTGEGFKGGLLLGEGQYPISIKCHAWKRYWEKNWFASWQLRVYNCKFHQKWNCYCNSQSSIKKCKKFG